jgi:outer membrane protein with beta-barrel domain
MYKVQSSIVRISFLLVLIFIMNSPARAIDLTAFGGVQRQGKLTLQSAPGTTLNLLRTINATNFGVFGVRFGHGNVFGGEHTLAFAPNFIDADTKAIIYNSDIRLQAPLPVVKPYGVVGLGLIGTSGDGVGRFGTKFAINYGGGVKFLPAGPVGLQVDVRGYSVPSTEFKVFTTQDQTVNFLEVSVGVVFVLSK